MLDVINGPVVHRGRLEQIGRIEAPGAVLTPAAPVARLLDTLDIILATSLGALFSAVRR
jgi:hypothetical protein